MIASDQSASLVWNSDFDNAFVRHCMVPLPPPPRHISSFLGKNFVAVTHSALHLYLEKCWEAWIYPGFSSWRDTGVRVSIYAVITEVLERFEVTAWSWTLGWSKFWSSLYSSCYRMFLQPVDHFVIHFYKCLNIARLWNTSKPLICVSWPMLSAHWDAWNWGITMIIMLCVSYSYRVP